MAITVMEVLKNLPRTNCGDCGQPTCLAFATHGDQGRGRPG